MHRDPTSHLTADELDTLLDDSAPSDVASHLATCGDCAALAASDRRLVAALSGLRPFEPTAGLADRVIEQVTVAHGARITTPRARAARLRAMAIGTSLAAGFVLAFAWASTYPAMALRWAGPAFDHARVLVEGSTRSLFDALSSQAWFTTARGSIAHPAIAVAIFVAIAGIYLLGLAALEHVMTPPLADADW